MKRAVVLVALLFLALYFAPLGGRPLFSPDETRYAEIPREMIVSGDWGVAHLNGLRYFEKTPFGYWLTAVSFRIFGMNNFAARLPSALSVGLTALILVLFARRWCDRARVGPLAAVVYLTSILVFVVGTANTLDSLLTLLLTGAMASFLHVLLDPSGRRRNLFLALGGLCCGLAVMTKGFLALVVPGIVLVPGLLLERRFRDMLRLVWVPGLVALATVLPWAVWIQFREPDFWRYFFWVHHVERFLDPQDSSLHRQPFWFFVPVLLASQVAWLPWIGAVISGHRGGGPRSPLFRWAVLWAAVPFLFFSASGGKLETYILPCMPPLALLIAMGLDGYMERRRPLAYLTGGAWVSAFIALAAVAYVAIEGPSHFAAGETWKWVVLVGALAAGGAIGLAVAFLKRPRLRLLLLCCAPLPLLLCAPWVVPQSVENRRAISEMIERSAAEIPSAALVIVDNRTFHAACWALERDDLSVLDVAGELAYGLDYPDSRHRALDVDDLEALLGPDAPPREVILILTRRQYTALIENDLAQRDDTPPSTVTEAGEIVIVHFNWAP